MSDLKKRILKMVRRTQKENDKLLERWLDAMLGKEKADE